MDKTLLIFYFFFSITGISAITLLFVRNIFQAALLLLVCLLSISALFILCGAEFPAVAQLLLYAGGVVVLIIFGIMLTNKQGKNTLPVKNRNIFAGLIMGGCLFFFLTFFVNPLSVVTKIIVEKDNLYSPIEKTGILLMTDYSLALEVVGVLLLIVLIGAASLAGYK